jgi:hypothetical protein
MPLKPISLIPQHVGGMVPLEAPFILCHDAPSRRPIEAVLKDLNTKEELVLIIERDGAAPVRSHSVVGDKCKGLGQVHPATRTRPAPYLQPGRETKISV